MSHQDKIKIYILFSLLFLFYSCKEKNKSEYSSKYLEVSTQIIGTNNYKSLYCSIIDSANNWNRNKLNGWINYKLNENVIFDSLLCINKEKNKFITAILSKSFYTRQQIVEDDIGNGEMDALHFFYGVNIDNKWYFFDGATCYLPRKMYQKDTHTPLSFSKLHEIAMKEVFGGYLIEKKTKKNLGWWQNTFVPEYEYKYEINEAWFTQHFEGLGWGDFNNQASEDWFLKGKRFKNPKDYYEFIYLEKVRNNWARKKN